MAVEVSDDDVRGRKALDNVFFITEGKSFMVGNVYTTYGYSCVRECNGDCYSF